MTATAVEPRPDPGAVLESVVIRGDLARLNPEERVSYYRQVCESLGLNPLTRPFEYLILNNRLTLYATRTATDQIRALHGLSVTITAREWLPDAGLYVVTAKASAKDGRTDESVGAVNVKGLQGERLANALMKAETKAKRRVTLSVAGLGWLDESEVPSVSGAAPVTVDIETGEVTPPASRPAVAPGAHGKPAWTAFWAEARRLGYSRARVHDVAGVASLADFDQDALDDLLDVLRGEVDG